MQLFLTPVLVSWLCRRRLLCCPLGDQHGHTILNSEMLRPLKPMLIPIPMTTLAALSVMILTSLDVRAGAEAVGAHMCHLRLFWDLMRLMRIFVPHVAAKVHVPSRF